MPTADKRRVLILAFDALRPDMVTPALMPNLCAFADSGVFFPHSRATFPTETRVNQTALVTGCYPQRHGIVGNRFLDSVASPGRLFNTGDETELCEGDWWDVSGSLKKQERCGTRPYPMKAKHCSSAVSLESVRPA